MSKETDRRPPVTDVIRNIDNGRFVERVSAALAEVVKACATTKKEGSITITLKVKPDIGDEEQGVYEVKADFATKTPRPSTKKSIFFDDGNGNLIRTDPRQAEMRLEGIEGGKTAFPGTTAGAAALLAATREASNNANVAGALANVAGNKA